MTAIDLANLLQKPFLLAQFHTSDLEALVLQYPYCQNLRLLLLKKYQQENPAVFDKRLALESTHALNRASLHQFLQFPVAMWMEAPINAVSTEIPPLATDHRISENPPQLSRQALLEYATDLEKKNLEDSTNIMLGHGAALETSQAKTKKKRFKLPRIPVFEDKNVLDFFEETAPIEPVANTSQATQQDDVFSLTEAFLKGLSERLKNAENQENNTHKDTTELDKLAEESLEENDEIASETLAQLLVQQGQFARAKRMYETLCTQFPEKADFFKQKIASIMKKN